MSVIDDWINLSALNLYRSKDQLESKKVQSDDGQMLIGLTILHGIICSLILLLIIV